MVLIRSIAIIALLFVMALSFAPQAHAHKNQQHEQVQQENASVPAPAPGVTPGAMHEMMEEHADEMEDQKPTTFTGRLMRWLGQMHPFAVHFPIALFPVSWLALIIARRRGHAVDLIRAFIIVAGVAAVGAAVLGWLSAGFALGGRDAFLVAHRWIGTALALIGGSLALWAWRKASSVNSRAMVWLLGFATLTLLVQGWLGAVLVHGMEHMAF